MPAFTWSSGMIRVFAGITTAERVNDAKQTARSDEIALRSITTIPGVDSVQRSPFALRQFPPVHRAGRDQRDDSAATASATVVMSQGLQRRADHWHPIK